MLQVLSYKDKHAWEKALKLFFHKDVYYYQEYCILYHLIGEGDPYLAIYVDMENNKVCYPFIRRPISLPFQTDFSDDFDIITPYGYGGPITETFDVKIIENFRKEFDEYCSSNNIISEFIRFHPLLKNHRYLDGLVDVQYDRETVFVDLTKSEEEILAGYHKNHRRNLKKAVRNQLKFKVLENEEAQKYSKEFYDLYRKTMDKLSAASYYYFSEDYVKKLLSGLEKNSMIAAVFLNEKLVSAALCMYEDEFVHYHLGCSQKELLHLGINVFLFHNISLWAKQKGIHSFHLGGGHIGRDSLFNFKYRFNQEGTVGYYFGRKIHDEIKYHSLVSAWESYHSQKSRTTFFPAYRANPINNLPKKVVKETIHT